MKIATITAVYNEEDLLPQHIAHYTIQGVDKIFILDNGSTDRTLEIAKAQPAVELSTFTLPGVGFDGPQHYAKMKKMVECIGSFDLVIMVDADELIVPEKARTIREAVEAAPGFDLYTTTGYQMGQGPKEAAYDPALLLVSQSKFGVFDRMYSKPAIVNPAAYPIFSQGIHSVSGIPRAKTAPGLFKLLHYPAPSEAIFLKRRLQKEPRIHVKSAMKNEAYFKSLYQAYTTNPGLSAVI